MLRAAVAVISIVPSLLVGLGPADAGAMGPGRLCFGHPVTLAGTSENDRLIGTDRRDVIAARGGNDVVWTKDGRDVVCAGAGHDRVHGEDGFDLVSGARGNDRLDGGLGADHVSGGPGGDELTNPAGADTLVGGPGMDVLRGGSHLFGGPGSDFLHARADETDMLFGGLGDDWIDGGSGFGGAGLGELGFGDVASYIFSTAPVEATLESVTFPESSATGEGSDQISNVEALEGSIFDDTLTGDSGSNFLYGRDGNDFLSGLDGFDTLDGGAGDDTQEGGPGGDSARFTSLDTGVVANLKDQTASGQGDDTLLNLENLLGSYYDDSLTGDDGPNSLHGSFGSNQLFGLAGDDTLSRGGGDAGPGEDTCFESNAANCEQRIASAPPPPDAFILDPEQGSTIAGEGFDDIRGGVYGEPVPRTRVALVALRLLTEDGCLWWSATEKALTVRPCELALWNEVRLTGQEFARRWELPIARPLPHGIYLALATLPDSRHAGCTGHVAPDCIEFRLTSVPRA